MSGETAVPMPERKIGTVRAAAVAVDTKLTDDQLRRVEALQVARQTLENKPGLFAGSKVEANRAVYDLTYLADWIIDGPDNDEPLSLETSRDASNAAYFNSGWEAVRREVLSVAEQMGDTPAVDWIRQHPGQGRLIDGPDTLETDWSAPAVSTSTKPGEWVDHDAAATADLRAARSDADDGN